jgi:pyruvate dehydrogenase E2 component (dihydrolipoamide acetyltransferase)
MYEVVMPRLSDSMEEGKIIKWRVKEGDAVREGQVLAEIESDKAVMELECFHDGRLAQILQGDGAEVAVGQVIATIAGAGEEVAPKLSGKGGMPTPPLRGHASGEGENMPSERRAGHATPDNGAVPESSATPHDFPMPDAAQGNTVGASIDSWRMARSGPGGLPRDATSRSLRPRRVRRGDKERLCAASWVTSARNRRTRS